MENLVRPLRAVAVAGLTGFDYWDWDVFGRVGPTPALDVAQHSASRVLSRRKNEKEKVGLARKPPPREKGPFRARMLPPNCGWSFHLLLRFLNPQS